MSNAFKNPQHRYVSDLRRLDASRTVVSGTLISILPLTLAGAFLVLVAAFAATKFGLSDSHSLLIVSAAVCGGYMALNIGANDVANNMGPAVGGRVLTITTAILIAMICETAGALLAGGDVVKTVAKGIIAPGGAVSVAEFQYLMLSAVLAAALWINLATYLGAPVSTTHSIVGGCWAVVSRRRALTWSIGRPWLRSPQAG